MHITNESNSSDYSRRVGRIWDGLWCLSRRRESTSQANHFHMKANWSLKQAKDVELSLIDTIESWAQLRPTVTEVVRRLFPKSTFIVLHDSLELSQAELDKLQALIHERSKGQHNALGMPKRTRSIQIGKTIERSSEIPQTSMLPTERSEPWSNILCVRSKEVQDVELRHLFCISSTASETALLVIACYVDGLSCFICFQHPTPSEREWSRLKNLEENILSTVARLHGQVPDVFLHPRQRVSCLNELFGYDLHSLETSQFNQIVHLICKVIAEGSPVDFVFLLYFSTQSNYALCPATSEKYFSPPIQVEVGTFISNQHVLDGSVHTINNHNQLEKFRTLLVDQNSQHGQEWEQMSWFALNPHECASNRRENGGIGYTNPENVCRLREDVSVVIGGVVRYVSWANHTRSRDAFTDFDKLQILNKWNSLECLLHGHNCFGEDGGFCSAWKNQFYAILSGVVVWSLPSTTALETLISTIRTLLKFDRCSVFCFDEQENVWLAELYNYPTEKQLQKKRTWRCVSEIISAMLSSDEFHQNIPIEDSLRKLNQRRTNTYWLPLPLNSSDITTIIQFIFPEEISDKKTRCIMQSLYPFCLKAMQMYTFLREKEDFKNRKEILDELLLYHMKIPDNAVQKLTSSYKQFEAHCPPDFHNFGFFARGLPIDDSVKAVMFMFSRLNFATQWKISPSTLARFILATQKSYRDPPYHNWTHAFCVGHFAYLCMVNAEKKIREFLKPLEMLALLVGTLCHDIDHQGFNNSFQHLICSPLSSLYGNYGSILEHHHVEHTMRILRTEGCNLFSNLSSTDEKQALQLVRQVILATDLETHLRLLPKLRQMAQDGYDKSNKEHRLMLLSLIATASDLSDQCKPWLNSRIAASLIYEEFFHQGTIEQARGLEPPPFMDRSKVSIPEAQINFLDSVVLPCFQTLSELFSEYRDAVEAIWTNRQKWMHMRMLVSKNKLPGFSTERLFAGEYDNIVLSGQEPDN